MDTDPAPCMILFHSPTESFSGVIEEKSKPAFTELILCATRLAQKSSFLMSRML